MAQTGKFSNFWFFGFLSTTPLKTIPIENVGGVLKNSGNLQQDGQKKSKIDGEMPQIFDFKVGNPKNSVIRNWANLSHP